MTKKESEYREILAKLQGSIMGIVLNLKSGNYVSLRFQIRLLEAAIKKSVNQSDVITKNN